MEDLIDSVTTVGLDDAAVLCLCVLLDYVAGLTKQHTRLHTCYSFGETFSRRLNNSDGLWVCDRFVANVICLVQVAVVAVVVKGDVEVKDVSVFEDTLIGNAMADDFVCGCADGLWEMVVVQRRRVGLRGG